MSTTAKKLLPPGPNTAQYPAGGSFGGVLAWDEGAASAAAYHTNQIAALDYLNQFNNSWLYRYNTGNLPYDAVPPAPPIKQWAYVTETTEDNGALSFDYVLVDAPTKEAVCAVPAYKKMPAPQNGSVSLMGLISSEGGGANSLPTIATVAVNSIGTDSAGHQWVRIA